MDACAVANLACRNGILTYCLGPEAPVDDSVRLFDALTAVVKVELFSISQVHMEELLEKKQAAEAHDKSAAAKPKKDPEERVDLAPVECAVKRLMDTLQSYNYKDDLNAWEQAINIAMLMQVSAKTLWFNYRQLYLGRTRKRSSDLLPYGGAEVINKFGEAKHWKEMLQWLLDHDVAAVDTIGKCKVAILRYTADRASNLEQLDVSPDIRRVYAELPAKHE